MAWEGYRAALRDDPHGVDDVLGETVAVAPWVDRNELAWVIEIESRWDPAARNPTSDASGLIQFMPATAKSLGTTTKALRAMSRSQQAPYVASYFARSQSAKPGNLYLAVFYPAALMWSDGTTIFAPGSTGWKQNPGLRSSGNGPVTAGSVRAKGTLPAGGMPGPADPGTVPPWVKKPPKGRPPGWPPKGPATPAGWGWLLFAVALAAMAKRRY